MFTRFILLIGVLAMYLGFVFSGLLEEPQFFNYESLDSQTQDKYIVLGVTATVVVVGLFFLSSYNDY